MKFENYVFNKSSFLSVEKDLSIITDKLLNNDRLKKLLHYTTKDALLKPSLTEEESIALLQDNIIFTPKIYVNSEVLNYIVIMCNNFLPNSLNPEFRDNTIGFSIVCHNDQWKMQDFQLRPYRIAAEIDSMLSGAKLSGIGVLNFLQATTSVINEEYTAVILTYEAIHGEEDRTHPYNSYNKELLYGDV